MDEDIKSGTEDHKAHLEGAYVDPSFWRYRANVELVLLMFSVRAIRMGKPKLVMWVFNN